MVMERVNNNVFKRKSHPDKLQYLKDGDDDNCGSIRYMKRELRAILGILIFIAIIITGVGFDTLFLN